MPTPPSPAPNPVLPALQAFGAALRRAAADERRPVRLDADLSAAPPVAVASALAAQPTIASPPLDTTLPRWPEAMVARIERLRDAANEADTRIRLLPDALGAVDVSLRREGEAVHVHFAAAEPATARLLADAQPRLAELAEAKGLKLGGGTADSGAGERRPPAQPQPVAPPRPGTARLTAEPDQDTRLA